MDISTQKTTNEVTVFKDGDFVLYRAPELYWTGQSGHTFVCKVTKAWATGTYTLTALVSGRLVEFVKPDYMRLLPPIDAMRDIDTAPLHTDGAATDMTAAALAWLTRQHATANMPPELPAPRG
ncbi:hypothetical protein OG357_38400 (plasmid) [Streptomyces sp. NBC_01255]|uniref:hypothetical protein n=1 Tax=Streptomyces sp. NBC_01255 TaxID=2903798 RepID=UPI002E30CA2F|nr:hypothetical protein [Streptomyces sp. NBC_01255]